MCDAGKDKQKLRQLARWLEQWYPSGGGSVLDSLAEMFAINALRLPKNPSSLSGLDEYD